MEQVLDRVHARDRVNRSLELLDQVVILDLTAEEDCAVLGVDAQSPLRNLGVSEDDALDRVGERRVV
jgi:hypothetical protein